MHEIGGGVRRLGRGWIPVALVLLLTAACGQRAAQRADAPPSAPPLLLSGQRVLVLPVQQLVGLPERERERLDAELLFALDERDARVIWIAPAELQRLLRRSPGTAASPEALPVDSRLRRGAPRVGEPLAGQLRLFAGLVDARLVLLPQEVRLETDTLGEGRRLRVAAVVLDARLGAVVWRGEAEGAGRQGGEPQMLASAAAALAERLVSAPPREIRP